MSRSAAAVSPDPAPTVPANMSFMQTIAALREARRCPTCGKTRAVLNVAGHGRPFRAERVTKETHCSCAPDGPAYVAPPATTAEVCEYCGEERSRAEFYGSECYEEGESINDDYIPGPSRGAHSFVRVELDAPAMGVDR